MRLRKLARSFDDLFDFLMACQGLSFHPVRHGCTGSRELARVWYRVHPKNS